MREGEAQEHRAIVHHLLSALRTIQLHGPTNAAATQAIDRLVGAVNALFPSRGELRVQFVDKILLVNDARIRAFEHSEALRQIFHHRGIGGIRFYRTPAIAPLREWLFGLLQPAARLDDLSYLGIQPIEAKTLSSLETPEEERASDLERALEAYARAIIGFREFVEALRSGRDPFAGRINVVRVVRDLVEIAGEHGDLLLDAVESKRRAQPAIEVGYAEVHAANTAVYAILIGKILEVDRVALLDLGTVALLADVGFAVLPAELTEARGALSPEERRELKTFMTRAVQSMLGRGRLNDTMMLRAIVAYEHHNPYKNPATGQRTRTHVYSRIVAVADAYDAMVSRRPWREAMASRDALCALEKDAAAKFDPLLVRALSLLLDSRESVS